MAKSNTSLGRPKVKLDLPSQWEDEILSMYQVGASDVEVKAQIFEWRGSFSNDLWDRWLLEEEMFSETIKKGRLLSQAWWEKTGRLNLMNAYKGDTFNSTLWYMNMKNRFGWKDRQEVSGPNGASAFTLNIDNPNNSEGES